MVGKEVGEPIKDVRRGRADGVRRSWGSYFVGNEADGGGYERG